MKIGNQRFLEIAAATLLFMALAKPMLADPFVFDPDGTAGRADAFTVNAFNLGTGNSLFRAILPFSTGATFQLLFHGAQTFVVGTGDNAISFEFTIVGSLSEKVTTANAGPPARVTFELSKNQTSESFIEVYSDTEVNADALAGTGFNDGVLVLRGFPVSTLPNVGTFSLSDPQPSPAPGLDQFGADDYAGLTSAVGAGATRLGVQVSYVDQRFFPAPASGATGRQVHVGDIVTLDIGQATPFNGSDPSREFTGSANPGFGAGPSPTVAPNIGAVNGSSGPDLQTQGTVGFSISAPTPTPSGTPGTTPTPIPGVPKIIVSASRTQLREGADSTITFSSNIAPSADLTINYSVGGSATLNVDYTLTGTLGTVVIPANQTSASIILHSNVDTVKEPQGEPATLTIQPGTGYQVSTNKNANRAVVLILDRKG